MVYKRAKGVCEYCLSFEGHSFIKFQMEHIISLKHGGLTNADNLALSCFYCNNSKGTDVATILQDDLYARFYHPRKDRWNDHFQISEHLILSKTAIGAATIKILGFNNEDRAEERLLLLEAGYFPHPYAIDLIK
ncbi:MAG: HNH endonuclease signature motif containing protein [Bacteroidota bacterium]